MRENSDMDDYLYRLTLPTNAAEFDNMMKCLITEQAISLFHPYWDVEPDDNTKVVWLGAIDTFINEG
jgi:hypothetical protein